MRVAFLAPEFPPHCFGVGTYCKNLTEALADKGVKIELISSARRYEHENIRLHSTKLSGPIPVQWAGFFFLSNFHLMRLRDVPLIHDNSFLPILSHRPIVVTSHYLSTVFQRKMKARRLFTFGRFVMFTRHLEFKLEKNSMRRAKAVISLSPSMTEEMVKEYGVEREKISQIPNGIKYSEFKRDEDKEDFVLYSGRLTEQKGILELLDAIKLCKRELRMTGEDVFGGKWIEKVIREKGVKKYVHLLGFLKREEFIEVLGRAKVFVLPSLYESFGIVALEAMASGTPLIISNGCGLSEYLEDGKNALVVSPKAGEIAQAIERLMEDRRLWKKLRRNGMRFAKKLDWSRIAKRVIEVYESVL
ncbi:MAG: glycosyltransferase family 4 protein [Nanoarchaeota archaeon]|nr:glycosyltransferase family 4 protein [Nanoarchaeota archaeon]